MMRLYIALILSSFVMSSFFSCKKEKEETKCSSSLSSPSPLEHQLLTGTCLDSYTGSKKTLKISSEDDFRSIEDQLECDELPSIDFSKNDLLGVSVSFTGEVDYKDEIHVNREDTLVEVLYCLEAPMPNNGPISHVETYISNWILIDKLDTKDSVIFTFK